MKVFLVRFQPFLLIERRVSSHLRRQWVVTRKCLLYKLGEDYSPHQNIQKYPPKAQPESVQWQSRECPCKSTDRNPYRQKDNEGQPLFPYPTRPPETYPEQNLPINHRPGLHQRLRPTLEFLDRKTCGEDQSSHHNNKRERD